MKGKKGAAVLAAALTLLCACGNPGAPAASQAQTQSDAEVQTAAADLLSAALDELFLYQGEIPVDRDSELYRSPEGRRYYPVVGFATLAELRTHSREIFSEGFCQNILDVWAADPEKPRFVEREGGLWATRQVGNMGWIEALVPKTLELAERGEDRSVVSVYSQSLLGAITREEFTLLREDAGWRLDSYYDFNREAPVEYGPTVGGYLAERDEGRGALLRLSIAHSRGVVLPVEEQMLPPFQSVLAALEYDPASVEEVESADESEEGERLEMTLYTGSYSLSGLPNGDLYITGPDGRTNRLRLAYPKGLEMLEQLINAAKWKMKFD